MLPGFEDITHELTDYEEKELLPLLVAKLCHHKGRANAISNAQLRQYIFDRKEKKIAEPRIRKITEHIRQSKVLEALVAGRFGYFIAATPEELLEWVNTMKKRRNALNNSIKSGMDSYKKMTGLKQPNRYTKGKIKEDKLSFNQFLFQ